MENKKLSIGDKVICPYNRKGIIEGFLSPTDAYVRVQDFNYKIRKGSVEKIPKSVVHLYGIKLLKEV